MIPNVGKKCQIWLKYYLLPYIWSFLKSTWTEIWNLHRRIYPRHEEVPKRKTKKCWQEFSGNGT